MKKLILFTVLNLVLTHLIMAQCPPAGFPPGMPGTDCQAALPLCQDINGYCNTLPSINNQQTFPGCGGNVLNNPSWFSFVAGSSGFINLEIIPSNCQNTNGQTGMQGAIYEGACTGDAIATQCNCTTGNFILAGQVNEGQSYFVVLDGCAGDVCDYEVLNTGVSTEPSPPQTLEPIGPLMVCPGQLVNYFIDLQNADNYEWTISDPSVAEFATPPLWVGASMDVNIIGEGSFELCTQGTNVCGGTSGVGCITIISENAPDVNDMAEGCVGDLVMCVMAPSAPPVVVDPIPTIHVFQEQDANGCFYDVICNVTPIILAPVDLGQVELCSPDEYEMCPGDFKNVSGIYVQDCQDPATGCFQNFTLDLAIFNPEAIIAQPVPDLDCDPAATVMLDGSGSTSFSIAPGASVTWLWTGPGIVGADDGLLVTVNEPGEYCITVTMERNGTFCTDQACVMVNENSNVPNPPTITGEDMPCEGTVYTYDATAVGTPNPSGFDWTTPGGHPFTVVDDNTIEIDWTGSPGGQLCVEATSPCGNSDQTCMNIVVGVGPTIPIVDGPDEVCAINEDETFTITNAQPNTTYNWSVPPGASFTGSGATIEVNFAGASAGAEQVCVTATNDCGTSDPGCTNITILSTPVTPDLMGPNNVCSNGTGYTYTVSNGGANDTYNWTVPTDATIIGSGASIEVDFNGAQSGSVCVTLSNECGNSQQTCQFVSVIQAPTATISGMGELCEGTSGDIELTITASGTGPWDVVYTRNSADPTMLTFNSSPHTFNVNQPGVYELTSLSSSGGCVGTVMGSATVTELPLPTAELSGMDGICENSGELGELTIVLTGEAPWTIDWESNSVGQAAVTANASPYTLNVSETQAGNITLTGVVDDNGCVGTVSGMGTVNIIEAPSVVSVMRNCDPTNTTYTVTIVIDGGDPTTYSVEPENGTLTGNTFVSHPIFSGLGYSFEISDENNCNPVLVEGSFECDCESMVGTMDQTTIETCGDGPVNGVYDPTGENLDGDDVLRFILHSGNGTSIVAPIIGEFNAPTNITFDPATMTYGTTYYLSAVVGNANGNNVDLTDDCLAVAIGTPIIFFRIPEAALSGSDAVCEGETATLTVTFTGSAPWAISYDDGTGTIQNVTGINANPYDLIVTPPATGINTICLTAASDANCPGTVDGCADVMVNTGITVDDWSYECNATATGFVVTIVIAGGDPNSYMVTGIPGDLVGNVFTSDEIQTGAGVGFSATVTDGNDCDPQTVSQTEVICDCETDAGVMNEATATICGEGPIMVDPATNTTPDGDDILVYYLHEGSGNTLNGVIASSDQPSFSFDPATMTFGTTYYISAVMGNNNGTGGVDLMDPCLSIAVGTPVVFHRIPTAAISGGTEVCPGDAADLMVELTGTAPWSVTINGTVYDNIVGSPFILAVTPDVTTVYNLTAVTDANCDDTVVDEQTVSVHIPPTATLDSHDCNPTGTAYSVCFTISGGDNSCYQVTPSTGTLTGNQFCSDPIPSGDGYSFAVTDCHDCPAFIVDSIAVDCGCPTLAGDLDPTPLTVCQNEMTPADILYDVNGTEVLDPDDVVCFGLYNGNVALATNPDEPVFSFNPGNMVVGQVYQICPLAGNDDGNGCVDFNDPCFSIGGCVDVSFSALPTAILSGTADICPGDNPGLTVELTGTGPWELTYQNSAMDVFNETAISSPHTLDIMPINSTVIGLTNVVDGNGCSNAISGNTANVNVHFPPSFINLTTECNDLETEYTVSFEIIGGDAASYTVTPPGNIVGNIFTSNPIPTMTPYIFLLDDGFGCGPTILDSLHVCNCFTEVGQMENTPLNLCDGEFSAASDYDFNEMIAAAEIRIFTLLSTPDYDPANVVAVNNNEPVFGFDPATMMYDTPYYIAAVAGTNDGTGLVDLNGFCVDVSNFLQVTFRRLPAVVSFDGPDAICVGDDATFTFNLEGTPPFTISYLLNGIPGPPIPPIMGTGVQTIPPIQIPATSTFTLVSIEDAFCSNTATQSFTVTVNPMVEAGTAVAPLEFCEGANQTIQLFPQLNGAQPGGLWTTQTGQVIQDGALNVGTLPVGMNTLTYTVDAADPCPDDTAELMIEITERPVADAGPDLTLNCEITSVELNIGNTTPGAMVAWTGSGISDPTNPVQTVSNPGLYVLTATIGNCTDVDEMMVTQSISEPTPYLIENPVSCFGETDGFVLVDSVGGGVPPFLFSLNDGPFVPDQAFLNLPPGDHTIAVEDDQGCVETVTFTIDEPVEVTVEITANFNNPDNDPIIQLGDSVVIRTFSTPGPGSIDTIMWSPAGVDSNCVGCPNITVAPTQQTAYSVIVDKDGCRAEALFTVFISKDRPVYVPNAFSPNDDRINDILHIFGGESVAQINSFKIFNRWGELVYEPKPLQLPFEPMPRSSEVGWDGKHRGEFLNPGVFVWVAEIQFTDGSTGMYRGDISLIRNN